MESVTGTLFTVSVFLRYPVPVVHSTRRPNSELASVTFDSPAPPWPSLSFFPIRPSYAAVIQSICYPLSIIRYPLYPLPLLPLLLLLLLLLLVGIFTHGFSLHRASKRPKCWHTHTLGTLVDRRLPVGCLLPSTTHHQPPDRDTRALTCTQAANGNSTLIRLPGLPAPAFLFFSQEPSHVTSSEFAPRNRTPPASQPASQSVSERVVPDAICFISSSVPWREERES